MKRRNTKKVKRKFFLLVIIVIIIVGGYIFLNSTEDLESDMMRTVSTDPSNITSYEDVDRTYYTNSYITDVGVNITCVNESETLTLIDEENNEYTCDNYDGLFKLDLTNLDNGDYIIEFEETSFNLSTDSSEELFSDYSNNVARFKLNDKLVTFNYEDELSITIEDFEYEYDIVIDVGHGGYDIGAYNDYIYEKELNLIVANYEKERYEEHGLTVKILRTSNDDYGELYLEDSEDMKDLWNKAYTIGYYGAVSKIVYSDHNNSIDTGSVNGYEIILSASLTQEELSVELDIMDGFNDVYYLSSDYERFYSRDYDEEIVEGYDMTSGDTYDFRDYYAVVRIPNEMFNVKCVIYEGSYLSDADEFQWYYYEEGYKEASEVKIKAYVESLGVTYIPVS